MAFKGHAEANFPATFDARKFVVHVHSREERDGLGVRNLAVEQRSQAVAAGESVEEFVRSHVVLREQPSRPVRELRQGAFPQDLVFLVGDGAKAMFVEGEGIGASQECADARAFTFSWLLLEYLLLELAC